MYLITNRAILCYMTTHNLINVLLNFVITNIFYGCRSAQKCILSSLSKQFPQVRVIAEETLDENETLNSDWLVESHSEEVLRLGADLPADLMDVSADDVTVWVDPLDGTKAFTEGNWSSVTTLIGNYFMRCAM